MSKQRDYDTALKHLESARSYWKSVLECVRGERTYTEQELQNFLWKAQYGEYGYQECLRRAALSDLPLTSDEQRQQALLDEMVATKKAIITTMRRHDKTG